MQDSGSVTNELIDFVGICVMFPLLYLTLAQRLPRFLLPFAAAVSKQGIRS